MWLNWGRLKVGPRPCPKKTLVFQWDEGVLVLAGWSRGVEGFRAVPGREGNKRTRALSHALLGENACMHLYRGRGGLKGTLLIHF